MTASKKSLKKSLEHESEVSTIGYSTMQPLTLIQQTGFHSPRTSHCGI